MSPHKAGTHKPVHLPGRLDLVLRDFIVIVEQVDEESLDDAVTTGNPLVWCVIVNERGWIFPSVHGISSGEHTVKQSFADALTEVTWVNLFIQ